jgi:hypothetical protein
MIKKFTVEEAVEVFGFLTGEIDILPDEANDKLYTILMPEMPYGVAKCRTGTPEEWYFDVYFYGWDEYEIKEWVKNHTNK